MMQSRRFAVFGRIAGLLAVACAGAPAQQPGSFQELLKREVELPAPVAVESADGAFRARVAGRLIGSLAKNSEGTYFARFDIGTQVPIACQLDTEKRDLASAAVKLSADVFGDLSAKHEVDKAIAGVEVGHAGARPYLGVEWIATLDGGGYQVELKVANPGDRALSCVHDEPGYSGAFERFFAELVASVEEEAPRPLYREIAVLSVGELEVGFQTVTVTRDAGGLYRSEAQGAMLVPVSQEDLTTSDDYLVELSRADGSVKSAVHASFDGTYLTRLELERAEGKWLVSGEMQGKAVSERFEADLSSAIDESARMHRVARGEIAQERYWRWVGALSPGKPIEHVVSKTGPASVRVAAGPVEIDAEVDERGVVRGSMQIGRVKFQIERVYTDGSL